MCIIMANEPRSYRTVLAATIGRLRPDVKVITVDPEDLDAAVIRLAPALVLCSRLTPAIREPVNWVLLYPGYETRTVVNLGGQVTAGGDLGLEELLSIVDQACVLVSAADQVASGSVG
jgi:hypothetical protein